MSRLPPRWQEIRLVEVTDKIGSGATPKGGHTAYAKIGIPLIRSQNVHFGGFSDEGLAYLDEQQARKLDGATVRAKDVLLNITGASIGRVTIAPDRMQGARVNQHVAIIRLADGIEPYFVAGFLASPGMQNFIVAENYGVTRQALTKAMIEDIGLPVPPLAEQRRIVAQIDSLSAKSRRAREHLDHVPRLVEKYKQAILAAAFRGELTRDWRKAHQLDQGTSYVRKKILAERDAIRIAKGLRAKGRNRSIPGRQPNLPPLPPAWEWLVFEECAWDLTVGHVGPMKDRYVSKGISFLRSLNVRPNRVDLTKLVFIDQTFNDELAKSQLQPGDLVVVRTGEPGVAAVVPKELELANCSDLVIGRLVHSMNPHYAAFFMNSEFARSIVRSLQVGVAQQHFNVGAMSEMPVPVPVLEEQGEVVRSIEVAFSWIDRLSSEATSARKLIDRLNQAVLAKAFRGELVPQDPNDVPASVLVERIRTERNSAAAGAAKRGFGKRKKAG